MNTKPIKNLKFTQDKYPDVLRVVNRLAQLEHRRPHDTAKRLLLRFGRELIAEGDKCHQQPANVAG